MIVLVTRRRAVALHGVVHNALRIGIAQNLFAVAGLAVAQRVLLWAAVLALHGVVGANVLANILELAQIFKLELDLLEEVVVEGALERRAVRGGAVDAHVQALGQARQRLDDRAIRLKDVDMTLSFA